MADTASGVCGHCVAPHVARVLRFGAESAIHLFLLVEQRIAKDWVVLMKHLNATRENAQKVGRNININFFFRHLSIGNHMISVQFGINKHF